MKMVSEYAGVSTQVLREAERFWDKPDLVTDTHELLRFSFFMGLFPFAGFLFSYTVTGRVWNNWPYISTTLPVMRALMCAGLQWVFYAAFPTISMLLVELVLSRGPSPPDSRSLAAVSTYSMVPMHLAALFTGALFVQRTTTLVGWSIFLYLLFFGYRRYLKFGITKSAILTLMVFALFAVIRQMFVFVIGF